MTVLDADTTDATNRIAECVALGECLLFLGSAVNAPPPEDSNYHYPESERPPLGAAFAELLAKQTGFAEDLPSDSINDLKRVSLYYEVKRTRRQLAEEIRNAVYVGKRPSSALRGLAALDFPLVITTNYDDLFETALRDAGKHPDVGVYSPDPKQQTREFMDPTIQSPALIKLHGDVHNPETIVITDEDYIQFVLRMSNKDPYDPVPETIRYHFKRWPTLFVGYSLMDYNLRLLFKTLRWNIDRANFPDTYSVDRKPDPLIFDVWHNQKRYVRFIAQDVWTFVPKLYELIKGEAMPP